MVVLQGRHSITATFFDDEEVAAFRLWSNGSHLVDFRDVITIFTAAAFFYDVSKSYESVMKWAVGPTNQKTSFETFRNHATSRRLIQI